MLFSGSYKQSARDIVCTTVAGKFSFCGQCQQCWLILRLKRISSLTQHCPVHTEAHTRASTVSTTIEGELI